MDYLLEDAVDFFGDFLPHLRRDVFPDFLGWCGHDSFSFTNASSSRTASAVSLERIIVLAKSDMEVKCTGNRMEMSPRYRTVTCTAPQLPRDTERSWNFR
jgi:hypothetical protein